MARHDLLESSADGTSPARPTPLKAWRSARDLRPGDRVITKDGRIATVKSAQPAPGLHTVHNFAVDGHHTYYVGEGRGVWVHNVYDAQAKADEIKARLENSTVVGTDPVMIEIDRMRRERELARIGDEMHDLIHSSPDDYRAVLELLDESDRRAVIAAVAADASRDHNDTADSRNNLSTRIAKNSARGTISDAIANVSTSDTAVTLLAAFISGHGPDEYDFVIQANDLDDAFANGGQSGDIDVFRELFNTGSGFYHRRLFRTAVEAMRDKHNGVIPDNETYTDFTNGDDDFVYEAVPGLFDGIDVADIVGSYTNGIWINATNGNLEITGYNTTSLESYLAGNVTGNLFGVQNPPSAYSFSPQQQTFTVVIPNPYLPPPPPPPPQQRNVPIPHP